MRRGVWHRIVGSTKTEQSERFITVTDELRDILLDLWNAQKCPMGGYILAGPRKGQPVDLYGEALNRASPLALLHMQRGRISQA